MSNEELFDFFISYTKSDERWAEWIAWQLEEVANPTYSVKLQAWDFPAAKNFIGEMQNGLTKANRVVAVLSPEFLASESTEAEWQAAVAKDPTSKLGHLVIVRVAECKLEGLGSRRPLTPLAFRTVLCDLSVSAPSGSRLRLDRVLRSFHQSVELLRMACASFVRFDGVGN